MASVTSVKLSKHCSNMSQHMRISQWQLLPLDIVSTFCGCVCFQCLFSANFLVSIGVTLIMLLWVSKAVTIENVDVYVSVSLCACLLARVCVHKVLCSRRPGAERGLYV